MHNFQPFPTILWLGKCLTSMGPYLAFAGLASYEQTQKPFLLWLETHPIGFGMIIVCAFLTSRILHFWERSTREQNRRATSQQWAKQYGWKYSPHPDKALYQHYRRFLYGIPGSAIYDPKYDKGRFPSATHTFRRTWQKHHAIAYTQYSSGWNRHQSVNRRNSARPYYFAITILETHQSFPKLFIRPQHWSDSFFRLFAGKTVGPQSLPSHKQLSRYAFVIHRQGYRRSKKYWAETNDYEFFREFLTEDIKQTLPQLPTQTSFEIDQGTLALFKEGQLNLDTLHQNLDCLDEIFNAIPNHLKPSKR